MKVASSAESHKNALAADDRKCQRRWSAYVFDRVRDTSMYNHRDPGPPQMPLVRWNIGRTGRAWTAEEGLGRFELTPEKFEMAEGKLFWDDRQRLTLLALLLENVGVDQAVRLGDPEVWRAAIRELS